MNDKNLALALGFFDGVHKGHVAVVKSAVEYAHQKGTKSAVITFKEHPQVLLRGEKPQYIMTHDERCKRLLSLGFDYCYELDFEKIAKLSGREYIDFLVENYSPLSISTGFNHTFGSNRSGTSDLLAEAANLHGYKFFKIPPVEVDGEVVSSSLIRKKLLSGNVRGANLMLSEPFSVSGTVQKGVGLASKIGFKTANIDYPNEILKLPFGAYSVLANGMKAVANFGVKPTFENLTDKPVLEVHILNFDKNIYGEKLKIEFLNFLRVEKKFNSADELISQIKIDIEACFNSLQ